VLKRQTANESIGIIQNQGKIMNGGETLQSIREVNLAYLTLAQRVLHEDRATGMFRLGLSAQMADLLSGLTLAQVVKLAACEQLVCAFQIKDHTILAALMSPARQTTASTHTAILLAGQPAQQFAH
jgi:flagellar transcriptional activator FlhD